MIDRCICSMLGAGMALVLAGQTPPADQKPAGKTVADGPDVRYARAWLELNEARLSRMQNVNRRVANSYPQEVIRDRQRIVAAARQQLAETIETGRLDTVASSLREAQRLAARDENTQAMARAVNNRMPSTISTAQLKILEHQEELSAAMQQRGEEVRDAPREPQLEWQLSQLQMEVARLRDRLDQRATSGEGNRVRRFYWH